MVCCSPLRHKELDMTEQLNNNVYSNFSVLCFMKERTETCWEFPGYPVVKTLPSYTGGVGSVPGQAAMIPHASWPKNQNIQYKLYYKFNKFKNSIKT